MTRITGADAVIERLPEARTDHELFQEVSS